MEKAVQFSVLLKNKPGALADLCRAMGKAKVNILAICVLESTEHGIVRMVFDNAKAAAKAIQRYGAFSTESEVFVLKLANRPGTLAEVAESLAENKLNIEYIYGSTEPGNGEGTVVLRVENAPAAERVLADL